MQQTLHFTLSKASYFLTENLIMTLSTLVNTILMTSHWRMHSHITTQ